MAQHIVDILKAQHIVDKRWEPGEAAVGGGLGWMVAKWRECWRLSGIGRVNRLKRSRSWFYKWLDRAGQADAEWYEEHSRQRQHAGACESELRRRIVTTRGRLEAEGSFVSAQMIAWELESEQIEPPSVSTIKRILKVAGLTTPKRRAPKGIKYPAPLAIEPGSVHQADFVGPRHVNGIRFYSLNAVDVSSAGWQPKRFTPEQPSR